mmetsp:Transcript_12023/g.25437  ORF Transcript_12023/g.25437 Transcript_12023/m.25437 type:complete len:176 (-) Transcript_12023:1048-1575(-)
MDAVLQQRAIQLNNMYFSAFSFQICYTKDGTGPDAAITRVKTRRGTRKQFGFHQLSVTTMTFTPSPMHSKTANGFHINMDHSAKMLNAKVVAVAPLRTEMIRLQIGPRLDASFLSTVVELAEGAFSLLVDIRATVTSSTRGIWAAANDARQSLAFFIQFVCLSFISFTCRLRAKC